jgi:hypothetical protein
MKRKRTPVERRLRIVAVIEDTMPPDEPQGAKNHFRGYESDDGGTYLTARLVDKRTPLYVDIRSATEREDPDSAQDGHATFHRLCGKRVRVTIESLEDV